MKKRFLLVGVALAVLLTLGIGAGAVIAQQVVDDADTDKAGHDKDTYQDKDAYFDDFVARVAEILDEDEDAVRDAIETARAETKEAWREKWEQAHRDKIEAQLDAAVEAGTMTQDEADEYLTWYDDKPDAVSWGRGFGKRHHGFSHHRGWSK